MTAPLPSPYRSPGVLQSPPAARRRVTLGLVASGAALAVVAALAGRSWSRRAPAKPPTRVVISIAPGHGRLLIAASDGTAWSIPEGGVGVGDERRLRPVREPLTDVRALAETDLGLWVLGRDGRVQLRTKEGGGRGRARHPG